MREDWEIKKLKTIGRVQTGTTPPTKDVLNYGDFISFVKPAHFGKDGEIDSKESMLSEIGLSKGRLFEANSVLMVCIGATIGKTGFAKISVSSNQQINALTPNDDCSYKFLYYGMISPDFQKEVLKVGTSSQATLPIINKSKWENLTLPIPPLSEQKQIVEILDQAFSGIDQAKANIEKNIANAKELFQSKLNEIFSQKGEGWQEKTLGEVCENLDNRRIPITKSKRIEGDIPYYGASGIVDYVADYLFDQDLLLVSEDGANLLARTYPIAFSISGKNWVNNHAHVLKFDNMISQIFIEYYLNSIKLDDYISGMAQPKLNQKKLNSIRVPFPTIQKQEGIINLLENLSEHKSNIINRYEKKISSLEELKKSILQKAFAGELTLTSQVSIEKLCLNN